MKKQSNTETKTDRVGKPRETGKARGPLQRDVKEVMAELVLKLSQRLEPPPERASETVRRQEGVAGLNRGRLTVGVDLGDQWSSYYILGLEGETLAEGQMRTTRQDFAEFFQSVAAERVVMEVGTHSAWARDVVAGCGHEVLVANPRQMEGPKGRKRKNDRIDARRLARVGRVDPPLTLGTFPKPGGEDSATKRIKFNRSARSLRSTANIIKCLPSHLASTSPVGKSRSVSCTVTTAPAGKLMATR